MDIKFHCSEEANFKNKKQPVRAFSYTDYFIDAHNHDFYEMNIVLGGVGIHRIEDSGFSVKRGDVFVIPPGAVHSYSDSEHLEVYHVLFKKDFIRDNMAEAERAEGFLQFIEIEPFLRQNCDEAMFLHLDPSTLSRVMEELKCLDDGGGFDEESYVPLCTHSAWRILYYLSFLLSKQRNREKSSKNKKYHRQILDTLEYIHQHFSDKITVESLAEKVYLSRSTLLRSFSDICGCSPTSYLNQYRVKRALELLESDEKSKTEIAHCVGFYDLSHMERAIKAQKSMRN